MFDCCQGQREALFKANIKYKKYFNAFQKRDAKLAKEDLEEVHFERNFLARLIEKFFSVLDSIPFKGNISRRQEAQEESMRGILDEMSDIDQFSAEPRNSAVVNKFENPLRGCDRCQGF